MYKLILLLFLASCGLSEMNNASDKAGSNFGVSQAQSRINELRRSYIDEYSAAPSKTDKAAVQVKYQGAFSRLLKDSLQVLSDMQLYLWNVHTMADRMLLADLIDNDVAYGVTLTYKNEEEMLKDKDYQTVKAFEVGRSVKTNFYYTGPVYVDTPGAQYGTIKIPVSISPKRRY